MRPRQRREASKRPRGSGQGGFPPLASGASLGQPCGVLAAPVSYWPRYGVAAIRLSAPARSLSGQVAVVVAVAHQSRAPKEANGSASGPSAAASRNESRVLSSTVCQVPSRRGVNVSGLFTASVGPRTRGHPAGQAAVSPPRPRQAGRRLHRRAAVVAPSPGQAARTPPTPLRWPAPDGRPRCLLGFVGTYRTLCMAPEPGFRRILEGVRHLTVAA